VAPCGLVALPALRLEKRPAGIADGVRSHQTRRRWSADVSLVGSTTSISHDDLPAPHPGDPPRLTRLCRSSACSIHLAPDGRPQRLVEGGVNRRMQAEQHWNAATILTNVSGLIRREPPVYRRLWWIAFAMYYTACEQRNCTKRLV